MQKILFNRRKNEKYWICWFRQHGKGMSINLSRKDDLKLIGFDINPDCGIALQNEKLK